MTNSTVPARQSFNWRLFWILCALNLLGSIVAAPYALTLQNAAPEPTSTTMSLSMVIISQVISAILIYWPLTAVGMLCAARIGLGAPILVGWLGGASIRERFKVILIPSIIVGVVSGIVLVLLVTISAPLLEAEFLEFGIEIPPEASPPPWQGFLAAISAGITEEVLIRLFLLSMLAWLGSRVSHTVEGRPTKTVLWIANILSAIVFGLLHLPLASRLGLLTPLMAVRTIALNSLVGLAFGWLYWTYGLGSAMIAHFSTDIVLHVITPIILPS
jgi:hypothetical protein